MRAVSVIREKHYIPFGLRNITEQMVLMQMEWTEDIHKYGELAVRDVIVNSICPDIYGMHPIKLAIALVICSGNKIDFDNINTPNMNVLHNRGQSHILLIGDPGLAKSKLLISATSIAQRAVHTTGMGSSSAGLTAAVVKVILYYYINIYKNKMFIFIYYYTYIYVCTHICAYLGKWRIPIRGRCTCPCRWWCMLHR